MITQSSQMPCADATNNQSSCLFNCITGCRLMETMRREANDLVTMQTFKYRMLNHLMVELDLSFGHLTRLLSTHTPVHPEIAEELMSCIDKQDLVDTWLAQDFVRNDKLQKLVKSLCKNGHANTTHALLAGDGLGGGKWTNGPHLD
ncbi:hypothetical protein AVEN_19158-1, partial [Araneus ventricosus]